MRGRVGRGIGSVAVGAACGSWVRWVCAVAMVVLLRHVVSVRLLRQTLRAGGAPALVVRLDGTAPLPFDAVFDRVLVDAPCSGVGTLRRDPDIKWSVQLEDLPGLARTQLAILRQAAVGSPSIGVHRRAGLDCLNDETGQGLP